MTKPPKALATAKGTGSIKQAAPAALVGRAHTTSTPPGRTPSAHKTLIKAFTAQLASYDPTGALVARSDDMTALARDAAQRVLDTSETWVEHLGAFYESEGVQKLLSRDGTPITRQAVHKRRGLLALTTGSGQVVYPAFQFDGPKVIPGLGPVLEALPEDVVSRWTVASWLLSSEAELDGERPVDVLRDQGPEGQLAVQGAARRWAAQLGA